MDTILIVGSGASGVHFSLSVLKKGYQVIMLDVGFPRPPVMNREDTFRDLKTNLSDPVEYFLGHTDAESWAATGRIWPKARRYASFP